MLKTLENCVLNLETCFLISGTIEFQLLSQPFHVSPDVIRDYNQMEVIDSQSDMDLEITYDSNNF